MLGTSDQIRSDQSLSRVRLFATPWITARQASLSITNSRSSLRLTSIESVMPSSHLILCRPLLLLPPIPPSVRVFSNESTLHIWSPKYWSFSFSIIPSKEIPGLISCRYSINICWLDEKSNQNISEPTELVTKHETTLEINSEDADWQPVDMFCLVHIMFKQIIWRRQWQPTPVLLPGRSHGRRSLVGCSPWGCEESDTTERLHFHFSLSCIGEGNGNPLQCSCLENPRDGSLVGCRLWGRTESDTTDVT